RSSPLSVSLCCSCGGRISPDHFTSAYPRLSVPAGGSLASVGGPATPVSEMVALVGGPLPGIGVVLGSVQRCGTLGQAGLGRLQCLLGGLGPGRGLPGPGLL